jgi:molybdopterin-containing oxidoreductase family membrane subunit
VPDLADRPSIWFGWPGAPHLWDSLAIILFGLLGLALLFVSSRPDLAARDRRSRGRGGGLALGWRGAVGQWRVLSGGVVMLGALYFALFVFVHLLLTADLALSLVPGWGSAVLPPYHAVSGLQAGVAATVLALAALRRFGGLAEEIGVDPFRNASKLLLAFAPVVFYFLWSELLTFWYGRTPEERWLLALLMFGPTLLPFALSLALNVVLPLLLLIWHPIRASVAGSTFVAALVLAGNLVDRVRLFVAAWSAADLPVHHLETHTAGGLPGQPATDLAVVAPLPPIAPPSPADALIVLGLPAAVILLYLLTLRLLPALSIWEHRADRLLRTERPYLKTAVAIIARPR